MHRSYDEKITPTCSEAAVARHDRPVHKRTLTRLLVGSFILILAGTLLSRQAVADEPFIVKNEHARAEIVIAETAPRSTRLAAQELHRYLEKISGTKLAVATTPSGEMPVQLYVGQSPYTEDLGITADGLEHGAYRIVSGDNWMVFIGDDTNFTPIEPWPRSNHDLASGKMQQEWDALTVKHWGYPHSQLHKHYSGRNHVFGTPEEETVDRDGNVNVWTYDERGSFNAVCGFLRDLGVRWYMPGEIGEVVPEMDAIALPIVDKTVRPDFPMRILNFRAGLYGRDATMWAFRLGTRQPFGRQAAHGLSTMTDNEYTLTHHPDWFALYGDKRHNQLAEHNNQLCYSNEALFREAVEFARVQFDHYDMDVVSIMPPDGYGAMCQCALCEGKDSPELGERGRLSNYIWEFVNRVAKEVGKTHPDKKISNCAYGIYTEPPSNIDKLEPNVQVIIVGGRRPTAADREELRKLRAAWAQKTDNPIEIFENYPFTGRGFYLPAYIPRVMGESINEIKGVARGEDIWITMDFGDKAIGYNHFLLYFTARMYWGGKEQDVEAMFDEYVRLFYGPAAAEMGAFFDYCEENWRHMDQDVEKANRALELFASAKTKVTEDSIHGRRIRLIDNYLEGLRNKRVQLAQKRGPVPTLRLVGRSREKPVIDGRLDDDAWQKCAIAATGQMRELQTGREPIYGTSFKSVWLGSDLYFAIRCEEAPGAKPNITATQDGDQAIWYGDALEILLDTESHSYYQIVVNPAGALVDVDRGASRSNWFDWSSQAEVATQIADDHWTVEIRIPVTQDENDPLHQVIGRRPTQSLPWHINICRQRIGENASEYSAFSPTGTAGYHEKMKFAHFFAGNSHQFPADPTVTDYLLASREAAALRRRQKHEEALSAYVALAAGEDVTDYQKSDALAHAASCARDLRDIERAKAMARQIPLEAVAKTATMENLLAERKFDAVVEQFGGEDWDQWPFWQIGAGAFARGRAYMAVKAGDKAEADFQAALTYTVDDHIRTNILERMGQNREVNLQDQDAALAAYRQNYEGKENIGAANEFRSIQRVASILSEQEKFDAALAALERARIDELNGWWRHAMLLSLGDTLRAAGRRDGALNAYRRVLAEEQVHPTHREAAEQAVAKLEEGKP